MTQILSLDVAKADRFERNFHQYWTAATEEIGHPTCWKPAIELLEPCQTIVMWFTHIDQNQASSWF